MNPIKFQALSIDRCDEITKHLLDLEVYLSNPVGVGEHSDIGEEIRKKVEQVDRYDSIISTLIARYGDQMLD